jgi:hypothetical protein
VAWHGSRFHWWNLQYRAATSHQLAHAQLGPIYSKYCEDFARRRKPKVLSSICVQLPRASLCYINSFPYCFSFVSFLCCIFSACAFLAIQETILFDAVLLIQHFVLYREIDAASCGSRLKQPMLDNFDEEENGQSAYNADSGSGSSSSARTRPASRSRTPPTSGRRNGRTDREIVKPLLEP